MDIGQRIRELREHQLMSQGNLAAALGVSQGHLSQVEAGKKNLGKKKIVKTASILGVEPNVLLHGFRSINREGGFDAPIFVPVYSHKTVLADRFAEEEVIIVMPTLSSIISPSEPLAPYGVQIGEKYCFINPNMPYKTGDLVLVNLGGSLTTKRLINRSSGGELRDDEASPLAFTADDLGKWIIIQGKIVATLEITQKKI